MREYPIKLNDVFCVQATAERRVKKEGDPSELKLEATLSRSSLSKDELSFGTRLHIQGLVPYGNDGLAAIDLTVHGSFVSVAKITQDDLTRFGEATPLVMLWPYARGYFADLGRMMGVSLKLLPTLNAAAPIENSEAKEPGEG